MFRRRQLIPLLGLLTLLSATEPTHAQRGRGGMARPGGGGMARYALNPFDRCSMESSFARLI